MGTTGSIFAIIALLFANGFFVAAEFALVKAKSFRIEALANSGSRSAQLTMRLQSNLESYLAACQLGIWGRLVNRDQTLEDGDRVEIYRPLEIDPRETRRRLAAEGKTMGHQEDGEQD